MANAKKLRAVVITAQGFEDEELVYPVIRLKEAGFEVSIATKNKQLCLGRKGFPLETLIKFYAQLTDACQLKVEDYDLVVIPGGFEGPDRVRQIPEVLEFIRNMYKAGKIVAAVCHGPWVLISAGIIKGKKITGYAGIIDDIKNAGAEYLNQSTVIDGNIVTGQHARDLGAFMAAILSKF
jgi:protease I